MSKIPISADSHITEPPNCYIDHIDPSYRDRAPYLTTDEKYGEEACAVIRRDASKLTNEEELRAWCKDRISRWKIPKYIFFQENFPMTPSGKIQKYKLQEEYSSKLGLEE